MPDKKPQYNPDTNTQTKPLMGDSEATLTDLYEIAVKRSFTLWGKDDLNIAAFGMIPVERLDEIVSDIIYDMAEIACSGESYKHWSVHDLYRQLKSIKTFKTELEKEVSVLILKNVKMVA